MQAAAPSVLTLEDDPTIRANLRLALEDAGFDVVALPGDDAEAIELAREHSPDVVVLRSRGEASRRILEEPPVPIIELPNSFSLSQVVEAVTGALAEIRDTREVSLRSIESLVEHLTFATPSPTELEQASWERGHVWRRISSSEAGTDDHPQE